MGNADRMSSVSVEARPRDHGAPSLGIALMGGRPLASACLRVLLRECERDVLILEPPQAADRRIPDGANIALMMVVGAHEQAMTEVEAAIGVLGGVPLVVLIDRPDGRTVDRLLSLGARGVVSFDLDMPAVVAALELVVAGGIYVAPPRFGAATVEGPAAPAMHQAVAGRLHRLSPRERTVLDLLRRSLSNREIADGLGIAEATVKIHVRNLLRKTRARNRVELALLAVSGNR